MDLGPLGTHGIQQETAKQSSGNSKMLMVAMAAPTPQSALNRELTWQENTPVEYSSRLPTEPERVALPSIRQAIPELRMFVAPQERSKSSAGSPTAGAGATTPPEYVHSPPAMKRRRLSVDGDRDYERARQIPRLHGSPSRTTQQFLQQQQQQPRPHIYQQPQQSQTQPQQRASSSGPSPMVPPTTSENWPSRGSSPYATNGSLPAMRSPMEPEAEHKQHVINAPELRPTLPSLPLLNLDRSASAVVAAAPPPPPPPPPSHHHHHHHRHHHPHPAASSARTGVPRYRSQDDYTPEEVPHTATAARIPTRPPLRTIEPPQVPSQFPPTGPAAASMLHHHHASRVDPPLLPYGPMHPFEPAHFSASSSSSAASAAVSGPGVPAAPTAPTITPASVAAAAAPHYPECLGGLTMGLGYGGAAMVLGSAAALGISLDATRQRKRRGNLPKETTDKLRSWFIAHLSHPYPTEDEKQELMRQTGLQMNQISNWFINARRRALPQMLHDQRMAEAKISAQGSGAAAAAAGDTGTSLLHSAERGEYDDWIKRDSVLLDDGEAACKNHLIDHRHAGLKRGSV